MLVSNVGTWMQRIAQDWLVLVTLGGGALATGITTGLQFLPMLLIAPFGGVLADNLAKRRLLMGTNGFLGLVGLALGVLVLAGVAQVWHVYVLAFLLGAGTALDNPARQAFVSEIVGRDDLPNAVALNSASFNAARLVGPAVSGFLIMLVGPGWVFIINGVTFVGPIIALMAIRSMPGVDHVPEQSGPAGPIARLAEGGRYVLGRPDIVMVLATMFFVGTFGMKFQLTSALMATEIYGKGSGEYGLLGSVMAIGTLAGALTAARWMRPRRRLIVLAALTFGVLVIVSGSMPTYVSYAVSAVPVGFAAMTVMTASNAYVQISVPQYVRGRVMSLYMMVFMGGAPLGAPAIGWVGDALGARWTLWGGGALVLLGTLAATLLMARSSGIDISWRLRPYPRLLVDTTPPVDPDTGRDLRLVTGSVGRARRRGRPVR